MIGNTCESLPCSNLHEICVECQNAIALHPRMITRNSTVHVTNPNQIKYITLIEAEFQKYLVAFPHRILTFQWGDIPWSGIYELFGSEYFIAFPEK
jgi:hypothetical protein